MKRDFWVFGIDFCCVVNQEIKRDVGLLVWDFFEWAHWRPVVLVVVHLHRLEGCRKEEKKNK
jgi:hypothetical protein